MKRRRRARRANPATGGGDHVGYWVAIAALLVGGVTVWAWKAMNDKQRAQALPSL
jgi:hypothetical protein